MTHETTTSLPASAPGERRRSPLTRPAFILPALLAVCLGALAGLGTYTFGYAHGLSYLSNDPNACTNCHVMQGHFDSWVKSSHHDVAACNDCHLPHHPIGKWVTKADNGFFHSMAFTLENFHEPIRIKPRNRVITNNTCLHCHQEFVDPVLPVDRPDHAADAAILCIHCHDGVGHAR